MENRKQGGNVILLVYRKRCDKMKIEMFLRIKFNRKVDLKKDYIVPGGYEMVTNGRNVCFDFHHSHFTGTDYDASICNFLLDGADYESFPEFKDITVEELQNISSIKECYVYVGERGETDLEVVAVESITFIIRGKNAMTVEVPKTVIKEYNERIQKEKKRVLEIKLLPSELKEKIMAQQLSFYSKFLDIPLEKLCNYDKEQLDILIDSTLMQMPDDLLHEFELELTGGKVGT